MFEQHLVAYLIW